MANYHKFNITEALIILDIRIVLNWNTVKHNNSQWNEFPYIWRTHKPLCGDGDGERVEINNIATCGAKGSGIIGN